MNKGKTRIRTIKSLFTKYRYVEPITKQRIQTIRFICIIFSLTFISFVIGNFKEVSEQDTVKPEAGAVYTESVTPTPESLCYTPRKGTLQLIAQNPGKAGKIRKVFGDCEWLYAAELLDNESDWNPEVINEIGACGIGQAYPCSKMNCALREDNFECQAEWVKGYVDQRYGGAKEALEFWKQQKVKYGKGWY